MKIAFVHDEKRHTAKLPYDGAAHVEIEACPACRETPAKVAGEGVSHHDHDTYYAPARTLCCGARGELRTTVSTVFGIEEDEAVLLRGRARVYQMIGYCGQTRAADLVAELEALGIGECTQRGELPPRRSRWFHDCRTFADWRAGRIFNGVRWMRDQQRIRDRGLRPDFVVVPDLISAGLASLELSASERRFVADGTPAYLVVQEEMTPELIAAWLDEQPDPYHGIFVGGAAIEWKIETGPTWVRLAHARGMRCHLGRCGPPDRVRWAREVGFDSIDSSFPLWERSRMAAFVEALGARRAA